MKKKVKRKTKKQKDMEEFLASVQAVAEVFGLNAYIIRGKVVVR